MLRRFVVRRLLLAVPTLFGICVVTFAMMHLAPGDPLDAAAGAGGPVPSRVLESQRRLYSLDLPLFYNSDPVGVRGRWRRISVDLAGEGTRVERGRRAAIACGTLCLSPLGRWLKAARGNDERWRLLLGVAAEIRDKHPLLVEPPAGDGRRSTTDWLKSALRATDGDRAKRLVRQAGANREAWRGVMRLGLVALPEVMAVLFESGTSTADARRRASEVASELTGVEGRLGTKGDPENARTMAIWREWWRQQRRDHVRFSTWERVHGRITETQFAKWLARILTLEFGHSIHDGRLVSEKLAEALPVTLLLSLLSLALAYLIAIPLGVWSAVRRGTVAERCVTVGTFVLYSMPSFWVAMMLILLFGGVGCLDWFPIYGLHSAGLEDATGWAWLIDRLHHLVLPVACLTYGAVAVVSRYQRGAMLEVLAEDYIRTARAKGLSERAVIFKHGLRNALLPTITLFGLHFPLLIGGSVIVERIFNVPGMGLLTFESFLNRDYPVIMAVSVLSAAMTLVGLVLADLLYAVADPRIRLTGESDLHFARPGSGSVHK